MQRSNYTGVKLGEFNVSNPSLLADALKGTWVKKWEGNVSLTVVRGHAMLSSPIVSSTIPIQLSLPEHDPFYAIVKSASGIRTVLCTDTLNVTLNAGEQIEALFILKEVQNGRQQ